MPSALWACCSLNWLAAEALPSKLCALQKEKQQRAIERREVGNLAGRCDPREGVPVLYLILSLPQSQGLLFIQRSNVWHFLPGGKPDPLFLWAAVSPAQQTPYIHLSAADRATFRLLHGFIIARSTILISTAECSGQAGSKLLLLQLQIKIRDTDSCCCCWIQLQTSPKTLRHLNQRSFNNATCKFAVLSTAILWGCLVWKVIGHWEMAHHYKVKSNGLLWSLEKDQTS